MVKVLEKRENQLLTGLNSAQRQAVTAPEKAVLILAGAGSGKTRVLIHRAAWFLWQKVSPEEMLLLTFTNKAAREMRQRLLTLGQRFGLWPRRYDLPLFAGTYHSFAYHLLRREGKKLGLATNFVVYDENDQLNLLKNLLKEAHWEKMWQPAQLKAIISRAKNDLLTPADFARQQSDQRGQQLAAIYRRYQQVLSQNQALDFSDLLFYALQLWQRYPPILEKYRRRYRYLLVDEYQDTNHSQYQLTKLLARGQFLTVVGDVSQAIYGWRGADYHNLLALKRDFHPLRIINLEQNYRSTANILAAADAVISHNKRHPVLHLQATREKGAKINLYQAENEIEEAEYVARQIWQLFRAGWRWQDFAILYRTNSQSRAFEEVFLRRQIPYHLLGGVGFYHRAEVKDVLALLRVVYQPADLVAWQRIRKNLGKRRQQRVKEFVAANSPWTASTNLLLEKILLASGYQEKLSRPDPANQRRRENIDELFAVSRQFPDLATFLGNAALFQGEEWKKDGQQGLVRLLTIHASKGLEFRAVFLTGLEDGIFPDSRSALDPEKLEEERRLCYVGITRAQERLFLTFARRRFRRGQRQNNHPSRFLAEIPEEFFDFGDDW